jgi:hypothetical protein
VVDIFAETVVAVTFVGLDDLTGIKHRDKPSRLEVDCLRVPDCAAALLIARLGVAYSFSRLTELERDANPLTTGHQQRNAPLGCRSNGELVNASLPDC